MKSLYNFRNWGVLAVLLFSSCSQWLDVKPEDKVMEDDLLTSETGFNTALNGIYLDMAARDVYGRELSCGYIEALAQMYLIVQSATGSSNEYLFFTQYNYTDASVKSYFDRTWQAMYSMISACNNLIEQAVLRSDVFSDTSAYNSYVSELYALRAFLHFDIFRLWGPVYSDATKGERCIPYYKSRVSLPESLSTAEEVVENVLADLHVADSLAPTGAKTYKMNICKYAIRALRARVYLYAGNKDAAYAEANRLYEEGILSLFPFVEFSSVNSETPDRLFYNEQIFLLENSQREELYNDMFDYMLGEISFLAPSLEVQQQLYPNINDYRRSWWQASPGNGKSIAFIKFARGTGDNNAIRQRGQSLLKVSELFLILAECAPERDLRVAFLDELRVGRGYQQGSVTESEQNNWQATLQDEYHREFYGEGQYFFYLKRNNIPTISNAKGDGELVMGSAQYVIPLPDSESQYR